MCVNGWESEYVFSWLTPVNPNTLNVINPETFMNPEKSLFSAILAYIYSSFKEFCYSEQVFLT